MTFCYDFIYTLSEIIAQINIITKIHNQNSQPTLYIKLSSCLQVGKLLLESLSGIDQL